MRVLARLVATLLFAGLLTPVSACAAPSSILSVEMLNELPTLVRQADVIVVGKVVGLVDTAPAATRNKLREMHRVVAEVTLQGFDETGRTLHVSPRGLSFSDGESYLLFLRRIEGNFLQALGTQLIGAGERTISLVRREVALRGKGVRPARVFWMSHAGGWMPEPLAEFFVDVRGQFEWKSRPAERPARPVPEVSRRGALPEPVLRSLIEKIRAAGTGRIVDDGGMVEFNWMEEGGEVTTKKCYSPDEAPGAELLAALAGVAREYESVERKR